MNIGGYFKDNVCLSRRAVFARSAGGARLGNFIHISNKETNYTPFAYCLPPNLSAHIKFASWSLRPELFTPLIQV